MVHGWGRQMTSFQEFLKPHRCCQATPTTSLLGGFWSYTQSKTKLRAVASSLWPPRGCLWAHVKNFWDCLQIFSWFQFKELFLAFLPHCRSLQVVLCWFFWVSSPGISTATEQDPGACPRSQVSARVPVWAGDCSQRTRASPFLPPRSLTPTHF